MRNASQLFYAAAELVAHALSQHGLRAEIAERSAGAAGGGAGSFGSAAKGDQIDDVHGRQGWIGGIACLKAIDRAAEIQMNVVVLHYSVDLQIDHWLGTHRIQEADGS